MDVSIIIASGRRDIDRCLESLLEQRGNFRYEVIVVHDPSNRPHAQMEKVRCIESPTSNPAVKRNIGARESSGKILAFIDDDAIAPPDWIERGLYTLAEYPLAAGCGGPNLPPRDQSAGERLTSAVLASGIGSGSGSYGSGGEVHTARIGEIHLVNFLVKRSVFETAGGFNEALGYGAEDSEFIYICKRMAGADFIYDPNLCVIHRRRDFGRNFFAQRYLLRRQNGRILWTRPGMYITRKAGIFLVALAALTMLVLQYPLMLVLAIVAYAVLLATGAGEVKDVGKTRWALAVMALHAVSAAGILAGWVTPPSRDAYRRLLRRP